MANTASTWQYVEELASWWEKEEYLYNETTVDYFKDSKKAKRPRHEVPKGGSKKKPWSEKAGASRRKTSKVWR